MIYFVIIGCIILLFGAVAFRGAPYVPTLRHSVHDALDMLDLHQGDLLVDMGSGDGKILKAAASRGLRAWGYEINPLLCFIAWLRCLGQRDRVTIRWRDMWLADWPPDTKAVFIFLAGPFMNHLSRKIDQQIDKRDTPLKILSYGFAIPGYLPKKISNGLYLYEIKPKRLSSPRVRSLQKPV